MSDDELLANILRRFISDPDEGYGGYWFVADDHMTLDKEVNLTDDEHAAVLRFCNATVGDTISGPGAL